MSQCKFKQGMWYDETLHLPHPCKTLITFYIFLSMFLWRGYCLGLNWFLASWCPVFLASCLLGTSRYQTIAYLSTGAISRCQNNAKSSKALQIAASNLQTSIRKATPKVNRKIVPKQADTQFLSCCSHFLSLK